MKTIKKNVYYCDHCGKRSLGASHMTKHEHGCTANPDRTCKLCDVPIHIRPIIEDYKKRFEVKQVVLRWQEVDGDVIDMEVKWIGEPITLDEIRKATNDCPNCMLAIIRQAGLNRYYFEDAFKFDYKKESATAVFEKFRREDDDC